MPKERWYVDPGSPLYVEVMNKVPVVAPTDFAFVERSVRETSLRRMVAGPSSAAEDNAEGNAEGSVEGSESLFGRLQASAGPLEREAEGETR